MHSFKKIHPLFLENLFQTQKNELEKNTHDFCGKSVFKIQC